jgi:hypothetical protein
MDRLSHLLRQAGMRGMSEKHQLMHHAADALVEVEHTMTAIDRAIERGDMDLVKLRLKHIANLLRHE